MKSMHEKLLHPISIRGTEFENNLWLAPLAGYSHSALRQMARRFGCGYTVTEMVSIEGILRNDKKTWRYAEPDEKLTGVQLFGGPYPERFHDAAKKVKERLGIEVIDINFGCPVRKVIRNGAGSALLKTPSAMGEIVSAVKEAGVIVEAKIRLGFDRYNFEETVPILDQNGADIIILHGRTTAEVFSGNAHWDLIKEARSMTNKIFIGNGDIETPEFARKVLEESGVDGLMIGRGAVGKPYLFSQIIDYFETGSYHEFTQDEVKNLMIDFAEMYQKVSGRDEILKIRSPLIQYVKGFRDCKKTRRAVSMIKTIEELKSALKEWN